MFGNNRYGAPSVAAVCAAWAVIAIGGSLAVVAAVWAWCRLFQAACRQHVHDASNPDLCRNDDFVDLAAMFIAAASFCAAAYMAYSMGKWAWTTLCNHSYHRSRYKSYNDDAGLNFWRALSCVMRALRKARREFLVSHGKSAPVQPTGTAMPQDRVAAALCGLDAASRSHILAEIARYDPGRARILYGMVCDWLTRDV